MTCEPGSIHRVIMTGAAPWDIPAHLLVLAVERIGIDTVLTGLVAEGLDPARSNQAVSVRGDLATDLLRATDTVAASVGISGNSYAVRIGKQVGTYDGDLPGLAAHVAKNLTDQWGPAGEGPCGPEGHLALMRAAQRVRLARELVEGVEEDRDVLIRRMLAGGERAEAIRASARLESRQRVYQIRDQRR